MNNNILTLVKTTNPATANLKPVDKSLFGQVYLVGAGPGDAELITVKAMRLLQEADAIVYDRLANPELLAYAKDRCDLIYVGKKKDQHSLPQEQICELLAVLARCGKNVVRLKGGDNFIFGRGGEEVGRGMFRCTRYHRGHWLRCRHTNTSHSPRSCPCRDLYYRSPAKWSDDY